MFTLMYLRMLHYAYKMNLEKPTGNRKRQNISMLFGKFMLKEYIRESAKEPITRKQKIISVSTYASPSPLALPMSLST